MATQDKHRAQVAGNRLRIPIRVKPGSPRASVGGSRAGALLVAVQPRAVSGKATEAALRAVAAALGLRRRQVTLITGATSRDKVVEVDGDPAALAPAVQRLLGGTRTLDAAKGVDGDE